MVIVGISWLAYWGLIEVFDVEALKAALITGVVFTALGLLLGERPFTK